MCLIKTKKKLNKWVVQVYINQNISFYEFTLTNENQQNRTVLASRLSKISSSTICEFWQFTSQPYTLRSKTIYAIYWGTKSTFKFSL